MTVSSNAFSHALPRIELQVLLASFVLTWLLVIGVRALALRIGMVDVPNARSSHTWPRPRGGGGAIVLVVLLSLVWTTGKQHLPLKAGLAWMLGALIIAAGGLIDDLRGLSVRARMALQLIAAALLLSASAGSSTLPLLTSWALGPLAWILGTVMILWSINLFNFMDGIDGIAAAQGLFVTASAALLIQLAGGEPPIALLALAGACGAFLLWNMPPAKIFMGDVGSAFIGFCLGALAFLPLGERGVTIWSWIVLNSLFFSDATVTLLTRLSRGQRPYEAHRSHVYQRLARRWGSHGAVTLTYALINLLWCLPWAFATTRWPEKGPLLTALELLPLCLAAAAIGAGRPESARAELVIGPALQPRRDGLR